MHILDIIGDQPVGTVCCAIPSRSASTTAKKRMMDLLQNILIKVKKSLKNQKALYKNKKVIVTRLSIATPEDPLTRISLNEDDSKDEVVGQEHLSGEDLGDEDEEDDEEADDDEEDEEEEEGADSEEEDGKDEESDG